MGVSGASQPVGSSLMRTRAHAHLLAASLPPALQETQGVSPRPGRPCLGSDGGLSLWLPDTREVTLEVSGRGPPLYWS